MLLPDPNRGTSQGIEGIEVTIAAPEIYFAIGDNRRTVGCAQPDLRDPRLGETDNVVAVNLGLVTIISGVCRIERSLIPVFVRGRFIRAFGGKTILRFCRGYRLGETRDEDHDWNHAHHCPWNSARFEVV